MRLTWTHTPVRSIIPPVLAAALTAAFLVGASTSPTPAHPAMTAAQPVTLAVVDPHTAAKAREAVAAAASRDLHRRQVELRKIRKARQEARAARQQARQEAVQAVTAPAPTVVARTSTYESVAQHLACVRAHESGGNYQAVNSGGYAGAYQLSPYYKDDWAIRYGFPQYASVPVIDWPNAVQDDVAAGLWRDTNGAAWNSYGGYTC